MKMLRTFSVALALLLAVAPAVAQQVQNHSVPIGRGGGVTGFGNAAPGTAGVPLTSAGAGVDPAFTPALNAGIQPGAADTYKGSLNGTTTTDVAMPNCTALGSALRYATGVGPNCGGVVSLSGFDMPINLGLSASANANALTFTLTQASGSAPSASNPVVGVFRASPLTLGTVSTPAISTSPTITIPSGATLGTANATPFRIWIFLVTNNGGTPALGVATCSSPSAAGTSFVYPCAGWESTGKTTVTISAGSSTAGVLYANTGVFGDVVRIVGYCDYNVGLVAAGAYASACTTLQVMGPGIKKPGEVVQTVAQNSTAVGSTSSAAFVALTNGLTQAIVPTAAPNLIKITTVGTISQAGAALSFIQLARNGSLIGNPIEYVTTTGGPWFTPGTILYYDAPGTASSVTYSIQGKTSASTVAYPASGTGITAEFSEIQG